MTPAPDKPPADTRTTGPARSPLRAFGWFMLLAALAGTSYFVGKKSVAPPRPPTTVTVERPMPSVVLAVQSLARLQSVSFHMERIIDLTKKEQALGGLVQTHDNILLVAVGDVVAGVDLGKLRQEHVTVEPGTKKVTIQLPPAEIFSARLDNERTYVHSRRTDMLGKPDTQLESEARKRAERSIHDGALEAGILKHAEDSAAATVRSLALSLGYEVIVVETQRE